MLVSFIQIKISDVGIVNHRKPIVNHFYNQVNNRLMYIFYMHFSIPLKFRTPLYA